MPCICVDLIQEEHEFKETYKNSGWRCHGKLGKSETHEVSAMVFAHIHANQIHKHATLWILMPNKAELCTGHNAMRSASVTLMACLS